MRYGRRIRIATRTCSQFGGRRASVGVEHQSTYGGSGPRRAEARRPAPRRREALAVVPALVRHVDTVAPGSLPSVDGDRLRLLSCCVYAAGLVRTVAR